MSQSSNSKRVPGVDPFHSREDNENRTVGSRERQRQELKDDVEKFLSHGGEIEHVDNHITADPPRKPTSNYGGRPI